MVGLGGLEPPTSPLSGARSSHLSYRPVAAREQLEEFTTCEAFCAIESRGFVFFGLGWGGLVGCRDGFTSKKKERPQVREPNANLGHQNLWRGGKRKRKIRRVVATREKFKRKTQVREPNANLGHQFWRKFRRERILLDETYCGWGVGAGDVFFDGAELGFVAGDVFGEGAGDAFGVAGAEDHAVD